MQKPVRKYDFIYSTFILFDIYITVKTKTLHNPSKMTHSKYLKQESN